MKLQFATYDVFTTKRFEGNPLAIVTAVDASLTPAQKQIVAKEFDYSETVFINSTSGDGAQKEHGISIYTPYRELSFAGHPTIGTSFHLLHGNSDNVTETTLKPPAGPIAAKYDASKGTVRLLAPHAITLHDYTASHERIRSVVRGLDGETFGEYSAGGIRCLSIVKGLTFALIHVTSLETLAKVVGNGHGTVLTHQKDLGNPDAPEASMVGNYCFMITSSSIADDGVSVTGIRSRMLFEGTREDPATGSAACAFAAFVSMAKFKGEEEASRRYRYKVTQGVEMGRESRIGVEVVMKKRDGGGSAEVAEIYLEGTAVKVMEGAIEV